MNKKGSSSFLWLLIMLAGVSILSFWFLFIDFQGLSHPRGMEQATIAREIARGNGLETKSVRPFALQAAEKNAERTGEIVTVAHFPNTVHAPLNPLIQSVALRFCRDWWEVDDPVREDGQQLHGVYQPDRVLSALAVVFFIASIGVNFLLLWRMFDETIAGFTALVLITCELLWRFTQTGMPHMLMLLLFSLGCLFLHRALERSQDETSPLISIIISAICFALLCLAHWLCLWIVFGALVFIGLCVRPRALSLTIFSLLMLPGLIWWLVDQSQALGTERATGIGFLAPLSQVEFGMLQDDELLMRGYTDQTSRTTPEDLPARLALSTAEQVRNILPLLGSVVAAPLFFISLLQPFRRRSTATLRWGILLMWLPAAIGMSFYGLHGTGEVANQIHFLFIPIMSGYGFAFVAILWNRLAIPSDLPLRRVMPLLLIALVSLLPLVLSIVRSVRVIPYVRDLKDGGVGAVSVNALRNLRNNVEEDEFVFADEPWAVAWYADRTAVWLPRDLGSMVDLIDRREDNDEQCAGITLSMATLNAPFFSEIASNGGSNDAYAHLTFELIDGSMRDQRRRYELSDIDFLSLRNMSVGEAAKPLILYAPIDDNL